jgi:hypothetical protein
MGYGLDGWGSNPGRGKRLSYCTMSKSALGPIQPSIRWVLEALSPGITWLGCEADHSPPSSAEAKNSLHGVMLH